MGPLEENKDDDRIPLWNRAKRRLLAKKRGKNSVPTPLKKLRAERKRSRMNVTKGRRQNGR